MRRAEHGLVDADPGGGVIKQRVARPGQGRSGGYRLLIVSRLERGTKRPAGAALALLHVIKRKGMEAIL